MLVTVPESICFTDRDSTDVYDFVRRQVRDGDTVMFPVQTRVDKPLAPACDDAGQAFRTLSRVVWQGTAPGHGPDLIRNGKGDPRPGNHVVSLVGCKHNDWSGTRIRNTSPATSSTIGDDGLRGEFDHGFWFAGQQRTWTANGYVEAAPCAGNRVDNTVIHSPYGDCIAFGTGPNQWYFPFNNSIIGGDWAGPGRHGVSVSAGGLFLPDGTGDWLGNIVSGTHEKPLAIRDTARSIIDFETNAPVIGFEFSYVKAGKYGTGLIGGQGANVQHGNFHYIDSDGPLAITWTPSPDHRCTDLQFANMTTKWVLDHPAITIHRVDGLFLKSITQPLNNKKSAWLDLGLGDTACTGVQQTDLHFPVAKP